MRFEVEREKSRIKFKIKTKPVHSFNPLQIIPKAKLTVIRSDPPPVNEMDVEIAKKAGKEIGFNFIECQNHGILVTDIVRFFPFIYFIHFFL